MERLPATNSIETESDMSDVPSGHASGDTPEQQAWDEQYDRLDNTGQFPSDLILERIGPRPESGADSRGQAFSRDSVATDRSDTAPKTRVNRQRRAPNRRGGRSYPEPSDSELDPYWNAQGRAASDSERVLAKVSVAKIKEQWLENETAKIQQDPQLSDEAKQKAISYLRARTRAREEIRSRGY